MNKLTWKIEKRKIKDLIPADYNPRQLSEKGKADLMESITRFGQVEPIVINLDNTIIGGHQRITIYADLKIESTEVMVPNRKLTKIEERELNLRLNKNTGEWDWRKLKDFFEINELMDVGFGKDEISAFFDKSSEYIHPTQKPVRLPERAIKKSCPIGGIVLEPFGGSGSTLIACEQLGRKCYAIELDPRYVDAIIKRWESFTNLKAKKLK